MKEAALLASRSEPLYPHPVLNASRCWAMLGRPEEGLSLVNQVLELEPGMPFALWHRCLLHHACTKRQRFLLFSKR